MKLYIISVWNKSGGAIGDYYVVAPNVSTAKRSLKQREPWIAKMVVSQNPPCIFTV